MAKIFPHMGDPHGDPQTSPPQADPHGFGAFLKRTIQEIHVDRRVVGWSAFFKRTIQEIHVNRRVVGWSAGRHVDHPCGGQISPWPARKVTEKLTKIDSKWP